MAGRTAYMSVTGSRQGQIKSSSLIKGHEYSFTLTNFSYGGVAAAVSAPSLTPVTVSCVVDALPKFLTALDGGETLTVSIQVSQLSFGTVDTKLETINLTGAKLTRLQESMTSGDDDRMELTFSFQHFQFVRNPDGSSFSR